MIRIRDIKIPRTPSTEVEGDFLYWNSLFIVILTPILVRGKNLI